MSSSGCIVATFYHFVPLEDYRALRQPLYALCESAGIKGTILLAPEGINATIAGSRFGIDAVQAWLGADGRFAGMEYKESRHEEPPFYRLKVRLKKEIVTLGVEGTRPAELTGVKVPAHEWNDLISDPDVTVIDVRNDYEIGVGSFRNAISPQTRSFRQFPEYVQMQLAHSRDRKIAMFCTGGIRCEKASAWMLEQGFTRVYQLHGGILRYLEEVPETESLWEGECFVFDNRVAVDQALEQGDTAICHGCRQPLSPADRMAPEFEDGVSCPACHATLSATRRESLRERQRQMTLARQTGRHHIGVAQTPRGET